MEGVSVKRAWVPVRCKLQSLLTVSITVLESGRIVIKMFRHYYYYNHYYYTQALYSVKSQTGL